MLKTLKFFDCGLEFSLVLPDRFFAQGVIACSISRRLYTASDKRPPPQNIGLVTSYFGAIHWMQSSPLWQV